MLKRMALLNVATGLCLAASCTIIVGPDGDGTGRTYLDQTDARITITQSVGAEQADVAATITDSHGRTIHFAADQSVEINGVALSGPNAEEKFTAAVAVAGEYVIAVDEPTRGVEHTTIEPPAAFSITSPAEGGGASLSGFTLRWSQPDERFQVTIHVSQVLFGATQAADFGPFTDTGSRTLSASDLAAFRQGADLAISVTKIETVNNVAGFKTGTATAEVTAARTASPRP